VLVAARGAKYLSPKVSEDRTPMGIGVLSFFVFLNRRLIGERGED